MTRHPSGRAAVWCAAVLFSAAPAPADDAPPLYVWKDASGAVRYTADRGRIPSSAREVELVTPGSPIPQASRPAPAEEPGAPVTAAVAPEAQVGEPVADADPFNAPVEGQSVESTEVLEPRRPPEGGPAATTAAASAPPRAAPPPAPAPALVPAPAAAPAQVPPPPTPSGGADLPAAPPEPQAEPEVQRAGPPEPEAKPEVQRAAPAELEAKPETPSAAPPPPAPVAEARARVAPVQDAAGTDDPGADASRAEGAPPAAEEEPAVLVEEVSEIRVEVSEPDAFTPIPDAAVGAGGGDGADPALDARIAELEEAVARDEEMLKQMISAPGGSTEVTPEMMEVARRLPELQAELRALREQRDAAP